MNVRPRDSGAPGMTSTAASLNERSSRELVSEVDARYAIDLVGRICRDVGPGVPGSLQERKRAEIIRRTGKTPRGRERRCRGIH